MGEAKRREDLGPTRKIQFTRYELMDVISFLVPQYAPNDPRATAAQKKINRDTRKPLRSALSQLGVLEIWHRARSGPVAPTEIPEVQVRELTVDAINTLLTCFNVEMDYRDMLNVGEIEDRLEDAKAGLYELPEQAPAAPEPVVTETPVLSVVPTQAE